MFWPDCLQLPQRFCLSNSDGRQEFASLLPISKQKTYARGIGFLFKWWAGRLIYFQGCQSRGLIPCLSGKKQGILTFFVPFGDTGVILKKRFSLLKVIAGSSLNSLKQITGKKQGCTGKFTIQQGKLNMYQGVFLELAMYFWYWYTKWDSK